MKDMKTLLEQLTAIKSDLKKAGVPPETVDRIADQINAYVDVKEEIIRARDTQFQDDARDFLVELQAATNKNVTRFSAYLRAFAEYVAFHVVGKDGPINDLVDQIPQQRSPEEE